MKRFAAALLFLVFLPDGIAMTAGEEQSEDKAKTAQELYNTGYILGMLGLHHEAIQLFEKSLAIMPTAEAYTYLGWTYGQMGNYERAIEEAQKAIRIDPDYGNPYNDIGVYLIEQGKEDEAIPYLEKAMRAGRYCCQQFPHFNLARIFLKNKMYEKARQEFKKSLEIDADYLPAREGLEILKALGFTDS
jgi:Tfp pilus assembly protein PilF